MIMKRSIIRSALVLAVVAVPAVAEAQARQPGQRGPAAFDRNPVARVLAQRAELNLTADQVARLEAIRTRLEQQNRPLMEQIRAQAPERQRGDAARQMTPEQRAELRQRMEAQRAQRQQLTPEQRAERRQQMQQLTPEQRREQMQARRAEFERDLTPEQRQRFEARRAGMQERRQQLQPVMQQIRENRQEALAATRAVLSAEQQARLQELHRQRGGEQRERWQQRPGGERGEGQRGPRGPRGPRGQSQGR
jgi:Spy/CpxP family protein refolding chaperone